MSPVEATGRAVCGFLAAHPDTWQGFEDAIRAGLSAFASALPPDLSEAIRPFIDKETPHAPAS